MGKAAENEKIKLEAAYGNNVGAGLLLGAVFFPLIGLFDKIDTLKASDLLTWKAAAGVVASVAALVVSFRLHYTAKKLLDKIED